MLTGVEHIGGDMFESVPKGDAIFMKVSDWIHMSFLVAFINRI